MKTKKILSENDIKNLVEEFFAKEGLIVTSFEINLTSRSMDRYEQSIEHVFKDITVTVEEKPVVSLSDRELEDRSIDNSK